MTQDEAREASLEGSDAAAATTEMDGYVRIQTYHAGQCVSDLWLPRDRPGTEETS